MKNQSPPADVLSPLDDRPYRPADDEEVVYYDGSPLLRGELRLVIGWTLAGLVPITAAAVDLVAGWGWYWWVDLLLIATGVGMALMPALLVKRFRYRITNYRIDFEHGLLSKHIDTLELWHVDDLGLRQSLLDRILGVGTIKVISDDRTTPSLLLRSVRSPRPLFEQLKQRIISVKRQRGVIKMDTGGASGRA
jgi:membrane protein YdbS with pleckstrin-like domain